MHIAVPERGAQSAACSRPSSANAKEAFQRHKLRRASDFGARSRALAELADQLGLDQAPLRIECYDISNLGPSDKVGSMVVFEDGLPKRQDYRKFRIKGVAGQDDFASMRGDAPAAVRTAAGGAGRARRRSARAGSPTRPALVVVDGGRGQLSQASEVLAELGLSIPHVGLAKRLEEVYFPDRPDPLRIPRGSEALFVLQHLRDEAHRSAVAYHRPQREKRALRSPLDDIPGVGPTRKKALLETVRLAHARLRQATVEELAATPGVGPSAGRDACTERLHEPGDAPRQGERVSPDDAAGARPAPGFTIITGSVGAGRSEAAHSLEDLGFFVVDNLPPALLSKMAELDRCARARRPASRSWWTPAAACSSRSCSARSTSSAPTTAMPASSSWRHPTRISCAGTRPPAAGIRSRPADRVIEGIRKERHMIASLRGDADLVIDTSGLNPHELRDRVREAFADAPARERPAGHRWSRSGSSTGRRATPTCIFDVRFLPNPHWVEALRPLPAPTGGARLRPGKDGYAVVSCDGSKPCSTHRSPATSRRASPTSRSPSAARAATTGPWWSPRSSPPIRERGFAGRCRAPRPRTGLSSRGSADAPAR